jgi:hypothetical protein
VTQVVRSCSHRCLTRQLFRNAILCRALRQINVETTSALWVGDLDRVGVSARCGTHGVRVYVDVPGTNKRRRKSLPVGPSTGKERLTTLEAIRKGAEIVAGMGMNQRKHLLAALNPSADARATRTVVQEVPQGVDG